MKLDYARLEEARQTLAELAQLPANWDSYGAESPSGQAVMIAQQLLTVIYERLATRSDHTLQPTTIAPLTDGGVQLEWDTASAELAIQISSTGELGYLLVSHDSAGRDAEEADGVSLEQTIGLIAKVVLSV